MLSTAVDAIHSLGNSTLERPAEPARAVMTPAHDDRAARAHALIERVAALLEESNALRRALEQPRYPESASTESERLLYFALTGSIEAGLIRTVEELLSVLRLAGEPVGPIGADWLARQERAFTRERE